MESELWRKQTNLLVDASYMILSPHETDEEIAGLLASEELNEKHLQKGKELLDRLQQEIDSEYKEKYQGDCPGGGIFQ